MDRLDEPRSFARLKLYRTIHLGLEILNELRAHSCPSMDFMLAPSAPLDQVREQLRQQDLGLLQTRDVQASVMGGGAFSGNLLAGTHRENVHHRAPKTCKSTGPKPASRIPVDEHIGLYVSNRFDSFHT